MKQAVTRSGKGEREIKEIVPINGEDGEAAMYVVNYADKKGWVVVSASTDYAPILAHGKVGYYFDTSPTYENTSFSLYRKDIINIYPTNN